MSTNPTLISVMTTFASGGLGRRKSIQTFVCPNNAFHSAPIKLSIRGENVDLEAKEKVFTLIPCFNLRTL